jgi:hypothetical protein
MKSSGVTYAELEEALRGLGFTQRAAPTYQVFEHSASGAVIVLPDLGQDEQVRPHHLAAVRETLKWNGIGNGLMSSLSAQPA